MFKGWFYTINRQICPPPHLQIASLSVATNHTPPQHYVWTAHIFYHGPDPTYCERKLSEQIPFLWIENTMPPMKTPTSSLSGSCIIHFSSSRLIMTTSTVIELLVKRVWYRGQAVIRRIRSENTAPGAPATGVPLFTKLPPEILEMIIGHLAYDLPSLRACTLTCRSWYIAATPHLHYLLCISNEYWGPKYRWSNALRHMHMLGLLPLVRTFWFRGDNNDDALSLKRFDHHTLRQFSALTNVRRLAITHLDIPSFMPGIQQYFGHSQPTVRELYLREPKGSRRQIIYFIGLFEHLEDLELHDLPGVLEGEPVDDLTLTPSFVPPLRGGLKLVRFKRMDILKDIIDLFGGIRFRRMNLLDVEGVPLLLGACARTLETLTLYPTDPRGERLPPKGVHVPTNCFAARSSTQDFDLSRNESLRTLQVMASSIDHALSSGSPDTASSLLKYVLSTITSPSFFEVVVRFRWSDFCAVESWRYPDRPPVREVSKADREAEGLRHHRRFGVLREAHKVRDFQLALNARVWDPAGEYSVRMLKEAVAEEKAKGGFDKFFSEPLVTYCPCRSRL